MAEKTIILKSVQFKRGPKANMPLLLDAEPYFTDEGELWRGTDNGNKPVQGGSVSSEPNVKYIDAYSSLSTGGTNWTPAFNQAFTDLGANGGVVQLGASTYTIRSVINVPSNVNIVGRGVGVSNIKLATGVNSDMINFDANDNCGISYVQITGNVWDPSPSVNKTGIILGRPGLNLVNGNMINLNIHDVYIRDIGGDGFRCYPNTWVYSISRMRIEFCDGYGAFIESTDNVYTDFYIDATGKTGLYVTGSNNRFSDMKIIFCGRGPMIQGQQATGTGNDFDAGMYVTGKRNQFANIEAQENYGHGVVFDGATDTGLMGMISDANGYHMISTNTVATAYGYYFKGCKRISGDIKATIFKSTVSQIKGIHIEGDCEDLLFTYTNDHTQDDTNLSSTSVLMSADTVQNMYSSSKYVAATQYGDLLTSNITLSNEITAYDSSVFQTSSTMVSSYTFDAANHEILGTTNWAGFPRLGITYKSTIQGHTYLVRVRVKPTVNNYWLKLMALYDEGTYPTVNSLEGFYSSSDYTDLFFTFQGATSNNLLVWVEDNQNNSTQHPFYVKDFAIVDITNATNVYFSTDTINRAVKENYFIGSYTFGADPDKEYNDFLASGTSLSNEITAYDDVHFNLSEGMLNSYTVDAPSYDILGTTNWASTPRLGTRGHSVTLGRTYLVRVKAKPTTDDYWLQLEALYDEAPYTVVKRVTNTYKSSDYTEITFVFQSSVTSSNFVIYLTDEDASNPVQYPFHAKEYSLIDITDALNAYSSSTIDRAVKEHYFIGTHVFTGGGTGGTGGTGTANIDDTSTTSATSTWSAKKLANMEKQVLFTPVGFRDLSVSQNTTGRDNTNQTTTSRVRLFPKFDCQDLVFAYTNFYRNGGSTLTANTNSISVKASLEINGTIIPVFFSGKRSATIEGGATIYSDPIGCMINSTDSVWVRTYADAGVGGYLPTTIGLQQIGSDSEGFTAGSDLTDSGTLTAVSSSKSAYAPSMVLGKVRGERRSFLLVGDSIMDGSGDINFLTGNTGFAARKFYTDKIGYSKLALGGESTTLFLQKIHLRTPLIKNHTDVICDYGINDISGGATLATLQANLLKIWKYFANKGLNVYQTTMTPKTTSTDTWLTVANQTVSAQESVRLSLNAWLRDTTSNGAVAQSGGDLTKVLDTASQVENNGKWIEFTTSIYSGTVQSSTVSSLTDAGLTSVSINSLSNSAIVKITGGTGSGQVGVISWGTTTTINLVSNWTTTPDATSTYQILHVPTVDGIHPSAKCHDLMSQAVIYV